jgi:hypothetical protein
MSHNKLNGLTKQQAQILRSALYLQIKVLRGLHSANPNNEEWGSKLQDAYYLDDQLERIIAYHNEFKEYDEYVDQT